MCVIKSKTKICDVITCQQLLPLVRAVMCKGVRKENFDLTFTQHVLPIRYNVIIVLDQYLLAFLSMLSLLELSTVRSESFLAKRSITFC